MLFITKYRNKQTIIDIFNRVTKWTTSIPTYFEEFLQVILTHDNKIFFYLHTS